MSSKMLGAIMLVVLLAASGCGRGSEKATSTESAALAPGHYDDRDKKIEYKGSWWPDHQFPESSGKSITYSDKAGDTFRVAFTGSAITYVFTKALNRGIAEVKIDGGPPVQINQYLGPTEWQAKQRFGGLNPGPHTLEVSVSGKKDPASSGLFVDLDAVEVEP